MFRNDMYGGEPGLGGGGFRGCYQPGVYVPLKALFLVENQYAMAFEKIHVPSKTYGLFVVNTAAGSLQG